MSHLSRLALMGSMAVGVTACSEDGNSIASLRHDLGKQTHLHSYAPEPAVETRQGDRISHRLYGIETRSPKTPYICVWRDTSSPRPGDGAPPSEIFLTCAFGTSAWTPPASLAKEAMERAYRDEAMLRVQWERDGDRYRMVRFEIELNNLSEDISFRSSNFGEDLAAIRFTKAEVAFQGTAGDPLTFDIAASVPRRTNRGEATRDPIVSLEVSGTAVPIPGWVLY